jgi:hypothetical protein
MIEPFTQTYSGERIYFLNPEQNNYKIEDIAHSLSMQCRFNGHTNKFYSVAQHSVIVSYYVPEKYALWGLLHDAAEAYVCDIPRPLRPHISGHEDMEKNIFMEIAKQFSLDPIIFPMPKEVKKIDNRLLIDEGKTFLGNIDGWGLKGDPLDIKIKPWTPEVSEFTFLARYLELKQNIQEIGMAL